MGNHRLNIVLSKTTTKIGSMIRAVIGGDYNHCSFYIDDEVDNVYGFSRKYRELWYTGCFTQENPIYYEEYVIYEIPISDTQYEQLTSRIDDMNENIRMYNYISAMLIPANIPVTSDGSFICSTFVAELMDKYTDVELDKEILLYRPMDIFYLVKESSQKGLTNEISRCLPDKEEKPLDFHELFKDWESSVKNVIERNIESLNKAMDTYENWLRDTLQTAEAEEKRQEVARGYAYDY